MTERLQIPAEALPDTAGAAVTDGSDLLHEASGKRGVATTERQMAEVAQKEIIEMDENAWACSVQGHAPESDDEISYCGVRGEGELSFHCPRCQAVVRTVPRAELNAHERKLVARLGLIAAEAIEEA